MSEHVIGKIYPIKPKAFIIFINEKVNWFTLQFSHKTIPKVHGLVIQIAITMTTK